MQYLHRILALVILSCCALHGNGQIKHQLKDFAVFEKALFTIEAKVDRHISLDSIQQMLAIAKHELGTKDLSPVEEYKLYARCINLIQSGHTQIMPTRAVMKQYVLDAKALPFDMEIVDKHLYVTRYPKPRGEKPDKAQQLPEGAEIIAIDGQTLPEWMKRIGAFIGSDEDEPVFEYFIAAPLFDFFRYLATETQPSELKIDYVAKSDTLSRTVQLGFPPVRELVERVNELDEADRLAQKSTGKFTVMGSTGYFRFTSFARCYGKDYARFLERSFKSIRSKRLKTVVIDVRGNGGGRVQVELLSYFLEKPTLVGSYKVVKRPKRRELRHVKKFNFEFRNQNRLTHGYKRMERRKPGFNGDLTTELIDSNLVFKGTVIVLTDEGTFSAASLLASQLKEHRDAQIMGSRAGGTYYVCNAGTVFLQLPKSHIRIALNPNACASSLDPAHIDPAIKNPDVEIVPAYSPKAAVYKKHWEGVVRQAIRAGRQ